MPDLTIEDVRKELGISQGSVYKLIKSDPDFKTFKVLNNRRMTRAALDEWKQKQQQKEKV